MTDVTTVEATTNETPDSCVDVRCDCPTLWSMAQQFCYMRLCNRKNGNGTKDAYRLINSFVARARRIAATYARLYLEQEEHGDPTKKGRYYWMALGAFASKTVACSLEDVRVDNAVSATVRAGLGKGNFWLFNDIAAWHWYYNFNPGSFDQCVKQRDTATYVNTVRAQVNKLPWAGDALPKIKNLRCTNEVVAAFRQVRAFDSAIADSDRRDAQLKNLMLLAKHEQGNILQPLIYDDADFAWWIKAQRGAWKDTDALGKAVGIPASLFSPKLKVAFVSSRDTDIAQFSNVASEGTKMEDFDSRMRWVGKVAEQFHQRMIDRTVQMEAELSVIAGWVGLPDLDIYPNESPAR